MTAPQTHKEGNVEDQNVIFDPYLQMLKLAGGLPPLIESRNWKTFKSETVTKWVWKADASSSHLFPSWHHETESKSRKSEDENDSEKLIEIVEPASFIPPLRTRVIAYTEQEYETYLKSWLFANP
jgi:hypothetical protein